ncbi:Chromosome partition protein Smc [Streptococcus infantarius subsp. infantarius]|nr:Chromosome partition protein Smc [Streptococcus infantarius subsp. infantarius]MCO4550858.1 Chromosome partition protein Smc [Streptococcus infantarius subsp. infantarius]
MITFLDERDVEHGALATIKVTNAVNGERSLTGEIESGDYVLANIERGWRLRFEDEFYVVTYAKPVDDGKATHVTFDAIHQFFWDFDKSSVHEQLNDGSHTVLNYLDFIFADSGYTYTIDPLLKVYAFEKQSFGYKSRLNLFNDIITASGVEFQVNGKVVRILEKTGTDLSTVVRKNFNMNELGIEKHIGDFVTYQKGFGAWVDENDHTKGRLVTEYTSPLANVYGKLEAEPLVDERYTQADNMIAALKANVDNSYSLSIRLDMEDLTRAGYEYTQPRAGDYIMAINETLDFQEKIRIVSFTSEYDVSGQLVKHEVTCNDIGVVKKLSASYNLTKEQAKNASDSVGKAVEMANKALVSADGKSTVYFGNEFPKDEPKGTLHKGDSLYLTVGDTTKMYYWTGADWEELPIVNDVEAFKEQIADELKDVPNREEFEATITEKFATSKAEIKTQIDTAKMQAESNAKAYADEINQATAEVAEQANTAANTLKSDLAKVKTDLTTTTSTANAAKTSASEAKQQLATVANDLSAAKQDLQNAVSAVDTKATNLQSDLTTAKQDLQAQASQLQAQASAQSELTKRVSSVEETANGTKTTVSELSKTVDSNTKNITSVTARTKTVEDDLLNTKTTLSQVQTTADNTSKKTATLETGLSGLNAKFENLSVGTTNHFLDSAFETTIQKIGILQNGNVYTPSIDTTEKYDGYNTLKIVCKDSTGVDNPKITYPALAKLKTVQQGKLPDVITISFWGKTDTEGMSLYTRLGYTGYEGSQNVTLATDWKRYIVHVKTNSVATNEWLFKFSKAGTVWIAKPQFEFSAIASDYHLAEEDTSSKVAEYKQTADQNYASLQSNLQTLDGTVKQNKSEFDQTAQGFSTRIESLETYKDGETTRANQYFESAKTETARQLTAERTAIAKDYVAKSTYTSDVTGIRNDLTATTTTANTTKTNLANYQASNDKAVANLQSNLQTANGNISSLQTKVEAVPGQITSAVSSVEGKIPTSLDSLNLMTGTRDWSTKTNKWHMGANWSTESDEYQGLKVHSTQKGYNGSHQNIFVKNGDIVTFSFFAKATNTLSKIKVSSRWPDSSVYQAPLAGVKESDEQITITSEWKRYSKTVHIISDGSLQFRTEYDGSTIPDGNTFYIAGLKLAKSALDTGYSENPTDAASDISKLNTALTQTANGLEQLSTQVTSQGNTITSHTNSINSLTTGLSAKVSQSDFNTLSGRVTTAENNLIATANQLSSQITSVEGQIPSGEMNLVEYGRPADGYSPYNYAEYATHSFYYNSAYKMYIIKNTATSEKTFGMNRFKVERNTDYTLYFKGFNNSAISHMDVWFLKRVNGSTNGFDSAQILVSGRKLSVSKVEDVSVTFNTGNYDEGYIRFDNNGSTTAGTQADLYFGDVSVKKGKSNNGWSPSLAELASSQDLKTAQSEIKQTTDSISATVSALDNSTVKNSSLTINSDGIVMKAGKSTTDVANAIGSYFAVNQNAINLFSDKINVKGSMIVDGAITSTKIASKTIDTAHLNGKIITADVISSNAITADAIKAGAVTTDKMTANSINGDRITAGTLDAAKIKAGSISASQIASGTLTSEQIKAGAIKSINIEASAITSDKIASNSIDASKIVTNGLTANIIKGGKLQSLSNATNFELDTGKLFYNNNNTGVFRVEDGASTMGLKFTNTAITVNGSSKVLSRVIFGGDRRESTLDDGKWDQGGFTGIVAETINGVASNAHDKADTLRAIADNIYFTHSYETDALTGVSAAGWKMETYAPDTSYKGNVVLKPYGVSYRQSNIVVGDLRLDNGDGSGYWMRATINVLKACFGHIVNGGVSGDALSAIRSELNKISGT